MTVVGRYIYHLNHADTASRAADGTKIISMSLYSNEPRFTWGAIRNAQLVAVFFPGWRLRVYVPDDKTSAGDRVPSRIINRLQSLGAQVVRMGENQSALSPQWWSFLTADDLDVDYFLVRKPDARLSDRDAAAVTEWVKSWNVTAAVHCIRDHASHLTQPITDGLWGARPRILRNLLNNTSVSSLIASFVEAKQLRGLTKQMLPNNFLKEILFPIVLNNSMLCHDMASSDVWPYSMRFPVLRNNVFDYVGMKYDQHGLIVRPEYFLEGAPFDQRDVNQGKARQYSQLKFLV